MIQDHPEGIVVNVRVQTRASKNAIRGVHGQALKITLTAPPVDGAANKACVAFLARRLKCAKADIEILSGAASRNKRLLIRIAPGSAFEARREALRKTLVG
jgi:uncharacterized protein (TIGR00251 family)